MNDIKEIINEMKRQSSVDPDRKAMNAGYILHVTKLSQLDKIDLTDVVAVAERTYEYFKMCSEDGIRPNMPGYALALNTTLAGLEDMYISKRLPIEVIGEIRKGASMVETATISMMLDTRIQPVTAIFILKNHLGYKDQSDVNIRTEQLNTTSEKQLQDKYHSVIDISDLQLDTAEAE